MSGESLMEAHALDVERLAYTITIPPTNRQPPLREAPGTVANATLAIEIPEKSIS